MKVLWLTNVPLPEASRLFGLATGTSGGWLSGAANHLVSSNQTIQLSVLFPVKAQRTGVTQAKGNKIEYYAFPQLRNRQLKGNEENRLFSRVIKDVKPDVVHIFGTELPHSLMMLNVCNSLGVNAVVSIQGLVSKIGEHFESNLPLNVVHGATIRNILKRDSVIGLKRLYSRLAENEREILNRATSVIGRTNFDRAYALQVNPRLKYYTCNETLRDSFYTTDLWDVKDCEKNSIFLSQGHYPIKGLHYMIEAMRIIRASYPNTKIYIGGKNIIKNDTLKDRLIMSYYGKYIKGILEQHGLCDHVVFLGPLNEKQMRDKYLSSYVFVCPSSIENSPNSLAEAMILGVPSIASYVGGTMDMLEHGKEGFLYQANAPYMLAYYVMKIFANDQLAQQLSGNAVKRAKNTHSRESNGNSLMNIYRSIIK